MHRTLRNRFRVETVTNLWRLYYATAIPQRTKVSVRMYRLCNGRGRWSKSKAAALFWYQDPYLVLSQFYKYEVCYKGVEIGSMIDHWYINTDVTAPV